MNDEVVLTKTLGHRLSEHARSLLARALVDFPWTEPAARLQDHVLSLAWPVAERFRRTEGLFPHRSGASELTAADHPTAFVADQVAARMGQSGLRAVPDSALSTRSVSHARGNPSTEFGEDAWIVTTGRPLPADLQSRLQDGLGGDVSVVRVHDDDTAEAVAGAHRADAVTLGRDIFFRHGRYQPYSQRGFGLLVHEATHVAQRFRPDAAWQRATTGGVQEDEEEALHRERAVVTSPMLGLQAERSMPKQPAAGPAVDHLSDRQGDYPTLLPRHAQASFGKQAAHPLPGTSPMHTGAGALPKHASPAPSSPPFRPMTASSNRDLDSVSPSPATPDLGELRRSLIRDIMHQLRSEFERGG